MLFAFRLGRRCHRNGSVLHSVNKRKGTVQGSGPYSHSREYTRVFGADRGVGLLWSFSSKVTPSPQSPAPHHNTTLVDIVIRQTDFRHLLLHTLNHLITGRLVAIV